MNAQKFTQKSLEAIQNAQTLTIEHQNMQLEQAHLLYALLTQDQGLIPQLLLKMKINLEGLEAQVFLSPVELYGYWLQHRQAITDGYQALEAKVPLQRGLYLLFRNLARGFRRLRKGKRGR